MNKRTISILLALTLAVFVGLPEAFAIPQYLTAFQAVYTGGNCGTCHVNPAGGGDRNSYGTMFENQPNHMANPLGALKAIGPATGTSPLTTSTVTATPNVTAALTPIAGLTPTTPQVQVPMGGLQALVNVFENFYQLFIRLSLPQSLDKYFQTQTPEVPGNEYVGEMFALTEAFSGIAVNLQENDMPNATTSYNAFASEYKNLSLKVPEWQGYFDIASVDKLGKDLQANDTNASLKDIGAIGATCGKCHADRQPQVWAKYYWRDFDTVNVSGMNGMIWGDAMGALAGSFDAIGVNAAEGKQNEANNSFNQFRTQYTAIKDACSNCHDTPRAYYVSDDIFAKIDQMGQNITSGNLQNAQAIQQDLGTQCYKCHVLHMPAQDMKDKMGK